VPTDVRALSPVASPERVELIDILRGFALFGILLVNMQMFGAPLQLWFSQIEWWPGPLDRAVELGIRFLAQGKFYTLFSILFGLGLAIQFDRAEARGVRSARPFMRRYSWLLVIGLIHAWLIWMGDILVSYALVGFLLLPFRRRKLKTLAVWTVVLLLIPLAFFAVPVFLVEVPEQDQEEIRVAIDGANEAYSSGDYGLIFGQRAIDVLTVWVFSLFSVPSFLGLFLIGLNLGRRRFFHDLPRYLPLVRRWIWWLFAVGVAGNAIMVVATEISPQPVSRIGWYGQLAMTFGGPAMTLFYVSAIVLLVQREAWQRRLAPLAAVGRMALSNYLLQSLICTAIFNGYGWVGLYGKVAPSVGLVLTVALYLAQIPLSRWWLNRFRFGPAEWLWRSLTYRTLQPMRYSVPRRGHA
jgi:uncharacterized protein